MHGQPVSVALVQALYMDKSGLYGHLCMDKSVSVARVQAPHIGNAGLRGPLYMANSVSVALVQACTNESQEPWKGEHGSLELWIVHHNRPPPPGERASPPSPMQGFPANARMEAWSSGMCTESLESKQKLHNA